MRGLWGRWLALLGRRESGEALALFRIVTGASLVLNVAPAVLTGLVPVLWLDSAHGGYREVVGAGSWLVTALGGVTPEVVWGLCAAALAAGALLIAGVGSRAAALVGGQAMLAISMLNHDAKGSYDALLSNALWLLVLADSDATGSLRSRLRSGRWWGPSSVAAWPRWLAIVQIAALYGSTGVHKVSAFWQPWGGYSALYYILQQPTWHRFDLSVVAWVYPLTQVATAVTWWWEVLWPIVPVWLALRSGTKEGRLRRLARRWDPRWAFLGYGAAMHLMIFALMDVGPFSWISLAFYPCLLRGAELRAIGGRLGGRGR